ncbi:hypothetical protein [Sneathiella glossodoripedis]|uniref:hypothetical protein n=1 Tax=Sneathiella glossodoripedis TaxID=418853 RepID=UPI0011DD22F4|nr:hypothetical protein [Sneathiella glossodoripedis]
MSDKPGQGTSKPSDTNSKTVADNGGSKSGSTASTTPGSAKIGAGQNKPKPDSTLKTEQASAKLRKRERLPTLRATHCWR